MNEKKNVTITDVAKKLKLSVATVSRALHSHPSVKESTRKRVVDMSDKMGFRINEVASSLRSNKSKTIGMIVPKIYMYFQSQIITIIQNELYKYGYNLIILQSNDSLELEKQAVETLMSFRVAGVIAAVTLYTVDFSHFDVFLNNNIPVIFYDRIPDYENDSIKVCGDDKQGGFEATRHLIEVGCKNILHISGPLQCYLYKYRSMGYKMALERSGIPFKEENLVCHELTHENAWSTLVNAFERDPSIDGIFTANDTCAIAALEFCKSHNLRVPNDVKIIGYSNDNRTAITTPSISSVEQFPNEFGIKTVSVLMQALNNEAGAPTKYVIPVKLVRRMST
ncbi:LacI family DNA-binding transcriptional regulator [Haoranjiania flava]|uniref:LacI family transcriptional regulator n=1 Tax=Haoranjiania flava TaxID=1856322 RepID=A0AAE3IP84_9BACT|nr:LacI family DNA-binding transcriptional regulator [Haoranjiania flava]MCU7694656.1 LacI family transcriptional regulator [Haoranjiania flava]